MIDPSETFGTQIYNIDFDLLNQAVLFFCKKTVGEETSLFLISCKDIKTFSYTNNVEAPWDNAYLVSIDISDKDGLKKVYMDVWDEGCEIEILCQNCLLEKVAAG